MKLRFYQSDAANRVREMFRLVASVLLVLATGAGKCLARGTPILMYDGTVKPVEDVRVGDLLMGPDSKPRRVLSLARGREKMYRVTPAKGDAYVVNESHILSLKRTATHKNPKYPSQARGGEVVNMGVMDYLRQSKTSRHRLKGWRAAVDFPKHDAPPLIEPYFLGAWLGDGHSRHATITTGDAEIAQYVVEYASRMSMVWSWGVNSANSVWIGIRGETHTGRGGTDIMNALRSYDVVLNKHIPLRYKTGSREERLQILAGLIDTDGHYDGKCFNLTLKNERLLDDAIFIARSLGFAAYKSARRKVCHNNGVEGDYWGCSISGDIEQVPCLLPRKRADPRKQVKDVLVTGITVEPIGEDDYFGFTIDGDHLFMLGDFTVTHNTVIFSYITTQAASKGRRVLVLAHRDMLLKQASAKLKANCVDHGLIMSAYTPSLFKPVQVASVQTLVRRLDKIKQGFDIIVIDEAHLSSTPSYIKVIKHLVELNPNTKILGVTATARRLDGKGLGRKAGGLFDDMVVGISFRDLVSHRFLLRPVVYGAPKAPDDAYGVGKKGTDLDMDEVAKVMDKPVITGNAIAHWRRICPGAPAVAWCANVKHAEHVAAEFNAAGIPAVALSGEDDSAERDRALAKLASGEIKVITFAMLLVEGVDCPAIKCVILLRPTLSLVSYLQTVGRGSRPIYADGHDMETIEGRHAAMLAGPKGDHFYVLDHAGLTFKHGFADDEREWSLDGTVKKGKKKKDEESIGLKQCTQCFLVHEPAPQCPSCGFVYPEKKRVLEEVEGELQEITPEMREQMAVQQRRDQGKARTVQEMVEKLGYSLERAQHIANARAEKDEMRDALIAEFQKWRKETGESSLAIFGVALSDLKTYKPKALKELKANFDAYRAEKQTA